MTISKVADLVLLSRNPFNTTPEELDDIEVLGTWIDGQPVDTRRVSRPNLDIALRAAQQMAAQYAAPQSEASTP